MNQSLLAQYIKGNKKPSPNQIRRILKGVQQIGKELVDVKFLIQELMDEIEKYFKQKLVVQNKIPITKQL